VEIIESELPGLPIHPDPIRMLIVDRRWQLITQIRKLRQRMGSVVIPDKILPRRGRGHLGSVGLSPGIGREPESQEPGDRQDQLVCGHTQKGGNIQSRLLQGRNWITHFDFRIQNTGYGYSVISHSAESQPQARILPKPAACGSPPGQGCRPRVARRLLPLLSVQAPATGGWQVRRRVS
jgi:hypothetical protein